MLDFPNSDDLTAKNAKETWGQFNYKFESLTHPDYFFKRHEHIKQTLPAQPDLALLSEIENNPWQSARFKDPASHRELLKLYADNKISWQQKATISLIIETKQVFGEFVAVPLLNDAQDAISEEALPLIADYLRYRPLYSENPPKYGFLTEQEQQFMIALVKALPLSEQYIFHFKEQHNNEQHPNGYPSEDLIENRQLYARLLNRNGYEYHGVLLLSHGIRNALGLSHYGVTDWVPVIPQLGKQSIDDVEANLKNGGRVTVSAESCALGLAPAKSDIHGRLMETPDQFFHDEYHSLIASVLGSKVLSALDKVIEVARANLGVRWSKDLWLLRDGDLTKYEQLYQELTPQSAAEVTRSFASCLDGTYSSTAALLNCVPEVQQSMKDQPMMFTTDRFPNAILLNFVLDICLNSENWKKHHVLNDEKLYAGPLPRLIKMVKFLQKQGILTEHDEHNAKNNILILDHFVRSQGLFYQTEMDELFERENHLWINWCEPDEISSKLIAEFKDILKNNDNFVFFVSNRKIIAGFISKEKLLIEIDEEMSDRKNNSTSRLCSLLELYPFLKQNGEWIRKQFIHACHDGRVKDVEYMITQCQMQLQDFELMTRCMFTTNSVRLLDWYINSPMLKVSDEPLDTVPMEVEENWGEPEEWTNDLLLRFKNSETSTEREMRSMREHYVRKLCEKRDLLAKQDDNTRPLKKANMN